VKVVCCVCGKFEVDNSHVCGWELRGSWDQVAAPAELQQLLRLYPGNILVADGLVQLLLMAGVAGSSAVLCVYSVAAVPCDAVTANDAWSLLMKCAVVRQAVIFMPVQHSACIIFTLCHHVKLAVTTVAVGCCRQGLLPVTLHPHVCCWALQVVQLSCLRSVVTSLMHQVERIHALHHCGVKSACPAWRRC
jgi:hypothetical protein